MKETSIIFGLVPILRAFLTSTPPFQERRCLLHQPTSYRQSQNLVMLSMLLSICILTRDAIAILNVATCRAMINQSLYLFYDELLFVSWLYLLALLFFLKK